MHHVEESVLPLDATRARELVALAVRKAGWEIQVENATGISGSRASTFFAHGFNFDVGFETTPEGTRVKIHAECPKLTSDPFGLFFKGRITGVRKALEEQASIFVSLEKEDPRGPPLLSATPTPPPPKEPSIFVSYRREDTGDVTGRIYDRLIQQFPREAVFKDVDSIPPGVNFKKYLGDMVSRCTTLLVVIGADWLTAKDDKGRVRLQNEGDFVRIEIEAALKRDIPVVPLLVQGAGMPSEADLPDSLKELSSRQAVTIGRDPHFHPDMDLLVKALVDEHA